MAQQAPVDKKARIEGLDVLHGLAIFGILVVNLLQMFRPIYLANSYGLGLYGDLTHAQIMALSIVCFACQIGVSVLWWRFFRMGSPEWIWRCLTYRRALPLRALPSE